MIRALVLVALLAGPALAQAPACVTIEQDRKVIEEKGWTWLGVSRASFVSKGQWVYYKAGPATVASSVVGGCVSPRIVLVGPYVQEAGV